MELDLGLKITRDADYQSCTDFHIAKDRAGPVFVSTETDSAFILSDADENSEAARHQAEGEGAVVEKKPAFFAPRFFMGSALIASLIVLVLGLVRTNSPKKQ